MLGLNSKVNSKQYIHSIIFTYYIIDYTSLTFLLLYILMVKLFVSSLRSIHLYNLTTNILRFEIVVAASHLSISCYFELHIIYYSISRSQIVKQPIHPCRMPYKIVVCFLNIQSLPNISFSILHISLIFRTQNHTMHIYMTMN